MANVINPAYLSRDAQVQKNMEDIAELKANAWKPNPVGEYSEDVTYKYNDLVAYTDGKAYYHFSQTDTKGVAPTDTSAWVVYQNGIQGIQGEQGEQGERGEQGLAALEYSDIIETDTFPTIGTVFNITNLSYFNRKPIAPTSDYKDRLVVCGKSSDGRTFLAACIVNVVAVTYARFYVDGIVETTGKGEKGADGQGYNDMGAWVSGNEYHPYDVVTFNGTSYNCTATIASSVTPPNQDTSHFEVFASAGLSALTYDDTIAASSVPVVSMSLTNFIKSSFNRTPETGDQFLAIVTYAGQSYLCGMTVTSVGNTNASATIGTVTALQGSGGTPTLYRHHTEITFPNQTTGILRIWLETISTSNVNVSSLQNFITVYGDGIDHIAVGRFMPSGGTALIVCTFSYDSNTSAYYIVGCQVDTAAPNTQILEESSYNLQFNDAITEIN